MPKNVHLSAPGEEQGPLSCLTKIGYSMRQKPRQAHAEVVPGPGQYNFHCTLTPNGQYLLSQNKNEEKCIFNLKTPRFLDTQCKALMKSRRPASAGTTSMLRRPRARACTSSAPSPLSSPSPSVTKKGRSSRTRSAHPALAPTTFNLNSDDIFLKSIASTVISTALDCSRKIIFIHCMAI